MTDDADPETELLDALVQSSFAVIAIVSAVAAKHDLSLTQLRVLAILRDHTPTMSELADYLGLDRSTVTGLVNRAEQRGLVQRIRHEGDRRSSRVTLAGAGHELAARGAAEIATQVAARVQSLSAADRGRLTRLLQASVASR